MLVASREVVAEQVYNHLKLNGMTTVSVLCQEYHIDRVSDWPGLRDWMMDNGYSIELCHGGYRIGSSGCEASLDFRRLRQIVSAERRAPAVRSRLRQIQQSEGDAWDYLLGRYQIQDVSDLEAEKVKRIQQPKGEQDEL